MTETVLSLANVQKSFGRTAIIRGLDLAVTRGERHAIIGPNGAGKSTTFHLISGRLRPTGGNIHLNGERIDGLAPSLICRRGLSRSFQITSLFPQLSVFENLRCAVLWSKGAGYAFWRPIETLARVRERTTEVLELIGLAHRRHAPAGTLSYAEQRALEIGVAVAGGAEVILLDEPTAGMSASETVQAVALIRKATVGRTLLVVEHDMGVVFDLADRISVLVYGQVIATDTPDNIRGNAAVREAYLGDLH
ncbi:MAG: ABC transporter ATP-binding protein [Pseudomonadota bacterium]|jgi:branched-chain amino acid transport system ATP-binding protein